ncbi:MAG: amidohydrolase family protein [Methanomicrobiales archaeon]|nr:amidohydrolase family protein [Methanomicrobiales archaeon]
MLDLVLSDVTLPDGRVTDLSIRDGVVVHAGAPERAHDTIPCHGLLCLPGAVDMHVHMRGGSQRGKEDWRTGSEAAVAGGVTLVVDQPNTVPPLTTPRVFAARVEEARARSWCHFAVNAGVASGSDPAALWRCGAMVFGELFAAPSSYGDGIPLPDLARYLKQIASLGALATIHAEQACEEVPEGLRAHDRLRSADGEVEAIREVRSRAGSRVPLHFCHVTSAEALAAAAPASCEVTPHHLLLSREDFPDGDGFARVNPPLRSRAVQQGLLRAWDRIPVIASDHAPHTWEEKRQPFTDAPAGLPGVETMVPLLVARVRAGEFSALSVAEKTSWNPAAVLGIPRAGYAPGERADLALYPREGVTIRAEILHSRCGWTPFEGREGIFPELVLLDGEVAYRRGEFTDAPARWFPGRVYIPGGSTCEVCRNSAPIGPRPNKG